MIIAQLSDLHLDGGERSRHRVERVVRELAGLQPAPDVVLITGDIADHGEEGEYAVARELCRDLPAPVLFCPGNHDVRGAYRKVLLGESAGDAPVNRAHRVGGALFAMCDSSIPGQHDGLLADSTLEWLDAELAAVDLPAFVCFHHPPVVLGLPFADQSRQLATDRLAAVVAAHPNVVALLCGHAHTPGATTFAGRPLLVAPGVVSTFRLPFEPTATIDQDLPPMLAYHLLDDDRRLTTHYRVVPI
ncbi:3',5'-cyclic AMP phosphodiesterase CpdA [Asanoa hainanensis]|uniref:3',5'-cyclic AMP phosphodiesterase CpdA n=1 Tax=Asanoa hainanensis TaxID=560556 RepID=A0A239PBU9_9ACTN|nr:phosphodiesterase [Asanoa hainanensis]SNT64028.1 3',5'-cyclic AMP phosphodiesterase CpdA [Asanoa hainanensis]